jgi:elongation factor Tu
LQGTQPEVGKDKVMELLNYLDTTIELPKREIDKDFLMAVEGTFQIPGRGTVSTGTVDTGKVKVYLISFL